MNDWVQRAKGVGEKVAPRLEGLSEDDAARESIRELASEGLLAWTVPARFGGQDTSGLAEDEQVSVRAVCKLRDELAWHSGMLDIMFVMQGLGSYPIALGGSDALKDSVLPNVAAGKQIAAFGLTEPNAGSSLGEVATHATKSGDTWTLNGTKVFISNAGLASFYTVLARTSGLSGDGGRDSLTMFHVPGDASGLEVERFEVMAPHPIGEVRFENVQVDDAQRLGDVGTGLRIALTTLGTFRTSVAAAACGFARRAFDLSCARLASREQFGRPLSKFQGLRFDIAEMDTQLRAAQLLVTEAATAVDAGANATKEVARAKLFATEMASWVCDRAVQHHGGLGVKRGELVERLFRDVRALRIYEGTSEIQKSILAKELL